MTGYPGASSYGAYNPSLLALEPGKADQPEQSTSTENTAGSNSCPAVSTLTDKVLRYQKTGDVLLRNDIILSCSRLVQYASVSTRGIWQKYCDADDIAGEAVLALMAAMDTYNPDKKTRFETYASLRMRGAVIDFIRRQDVIPRSVRRFSREMETAFGYLYVQFGREPSSEEIAGHMGLPIEKFQRMMADASAAAALSFEEMVATGGFDRSDEDVETIGLGAGWRVEQGLDRKELVDALAKAIEDLKEQQRLVVTLHYHEHLKFADIGKVMGVTESRVCQIHTKAIAVLKNALISFHPNPSGQKEKTKTVKNKSRAES